MHIFKNSGIWCFLRLYDTNVTLLMCTPCHRCDTFGKIILSDRALFSEKIETRVTLYAESRASLPRLGRPQKKPLGDCLGQPFACPFKARILIKKEPRTVAPSEASAGFKARRKEDIGQSPRGGSTRNLPYKISLDNTRRQRATDRPHRRRWGYFPSLPSRRRRQNISATPRISGGTRRAPV